MRLFALLFVFAAVASRGEVDVPRVVAAIRVVENSATVGAAGERGPWQFLPSVWRQYSARPLAWASGHSPEMRAEQERVAVAHVKWILARLPGLGLPLSAESVGLVHNAGYGRVRRAAVLARQRDFAQRVANVYAEGAR